MHWGLHTVSTLHLRDSDDGCENPHTRWASEHHDHRNLADATKLSGFRSLTCWHVRLFFTVHCKVGYIQGQMGYKHTMLTYRLDMFLTNIPACIYHIILVFISNHIRKDETERSLWWRNIKISHLITFSLPKYNSCYPIPKGPCPPPTNGLAPLSLFSPGLWI